jgi:AAA ATPase domain
VRREVLERDAELAALADAVHAAAGGAGSVVLVMGEAGIGKSSLVEALRARLPAEGRMLVGYCDDLATPRTLGPFRDLVGSVRTELSRAVMDGSDRDRVHAALRAELSGPEHPTVLVIEDVHWADDATLDALRYLIRRMADLPAVLILTYRDDELDREHLLPGLLGPASRTEHVRHLALGRLSPQAVRQLSAGRPVDADDLFALTSGNPFFVARAASSGTVRTPRGTRPGPARTVRPSRTSASSWSMPAGSPRTSEPNCWSDTQSSATRSARPNARPSWASGTPGISSDHNAGTLTTIASWVDRAITTTASVSADGFSSRCGTCGGTQT